MARPADPSARLTALKAAIAAAVEAIEKEPDRRAGIRLADDLRDCLADAAENAAALRGEIALHLRTDERLSLAELAEILGGVSTTRASQILASARARTRSAHAGQQQPEAQHVESLGVSAEIESMRRAYAEAQAAIEAADSADEAARQANALREAADDLVRRAADLRARMARRLKDEEDLSIAALAERLGVSKARADQLLRTTHADDRPQI